MTDNYLARNDRSRECADHNGDRWTPEEVEYLLKHWPEKQRAEDVAKHLGRTIAACFQRYSILTSTGTGPSRPRSVEVCVSICTGCWMALPASGVCDSPGCSDD